MAGKASRLEIESLYKTCLDLHRSGQLSKAEALYIQILKAAPNNPEIIQNFAILQFQQGTPEKALQSIRRARALGRPSASLEYHHGMFLGEMGCHAEAEQRFRACLAIAPNSGEAMGSLGATLVALDRYAEAATCLQRAVELTPSLLQPWFNLGSVLLFLNEHAAAEAAFQRALEIAPRDREVQYHLGRMQYQNQKLPEAIATFEALLKAQPAHQGALGSLLRAKLRICDWADLDRHRTAFKSGLVHAAPGNPERTPSPYSALLVCDDPAECLAAARAGAPALSRAAMQNKARVARPRGRTIRIAYLSADYREHATSYLISELIELHDRSAFEVTGLSFGPDDASPMRRRMEAAFDRFVDVTERSAADIAKTLADLSIDIAVDLQGFNQYNRMQIFSHRAAPLQVLYLGWPGTSGADFYDYVLADPIVLPTENFAHFTEKVVWLPNCYQPNDTRRAVTSAAPSRAECGLPESGFVFCCFNNTFKILPEIFDIWMRLLLAVPGSVLWLMETSALCKANLRREAASRGVDEPRLVFAPHLPNDQHIARLANADLFLDTLHYNAHTTASDALWQGVPVVTCTGRTFASRVATSLVHNAGIPDFAVSNLAEYEALALRLAADPSIIRRSKQQLLDQRLQLPLFDTEQLVRDIETAYREMVRRSTEGIPPDFLDVRTIGAEPA